METIGVGNGVLGLALGVITLLYFSNFIIPDIGFPQNYVISHDR